MRPQSVTNEDVIRWDEIRKNSKTPDYQILGIREPSPEVWYAGEWLGEELAKVGCGNNIIQKICFAMGQRQSALNQSWEPAVERYMKDGSYEKPGPELGHKLLSEVFDGKQPTKDEMLSYLCKNWNIPKEKMMGMLLKAAMEGEPQLPPEIAAN